MIVRPASVPIAELVLRVALVGSLVGASVVHATEAIPHGREWVLSGAFFAALAVVQLALAVMLGMTDDVRARRAAFAVTLTALTVWTISRTVGVPFGPHAGEAEAIGRSDALATAFELVTAATLLVRRSRAALAIAAALVALPAFGIAVAAAPHPHHAHVVRDAPRMDPVEHLRAHERHAHDH